MSAATEELVAYVAAMPTEKRERWMREYEITGKAADVLMRKVRMLWAKEAFTKLKAELESPAGRAAVEALNAKWAREGRAE